MMLPARAPRVRLRMVLALLGLVLAAQMQSVSADSIGWCKTDPKISVAGHVAHIYVYSQNEILTTATGPTEVYVTVPRGYAASAYVLYQDNGFGFGYSVVFDESNRLKVNRDGSFPIVASVKVPSTRTATLVTVELALSDGVTVISAVDTRVNRVATVSGVI